MSGKPDLDALERANLGRVVRPEDWMALLAYARELERRSELRSMLLREQTARLGAANLRVIELESASQHDAWRADAERLDYLDRLNAGLNRHYGTDYGWQLILSPNIVRLMSGPGGRGHCAAIDLNDSKARGVKSCRAVIDDAMKRSGEQKA